MDLDTLYDDLERDEDDLALDAETAGVDDKDNNSKGHNDDDNNVPNNKDSDDGNDDNNEDDEVPIQGVGVDNPGVDIEIPDPEVDAEIPGVDAGNINQHSDKEEQENDKVPERTSGTRSLRRQKRVEYNNMFNINDVGECRNPRPRSGCRNPRSGCREYQSTF